MKRSSIGRLIVPSTIALMLAVGMHALADDEHQAPGPKVGESVPAFELSDQVGKQHTLKTIAGERPYVALVFYRSAAW